MDNGKLRKIAFWVKSSILIGCASIGLSAIAVRLVEAPPYVLLLQQNTARLDKLEQRVDNIDRRVVHIEDTIERLNLDDAPPITTKKGQ